jgi:hypothetical protein
MSYLSSDVNCYWWRRFATANVRNWQKELKS